ncbi:hypothetical protein L596_009264 [Steinernema carpocapsae]|uniref:Tyrosine-protein kinase n=1 Tax=Steinernema carpocapsae TaxID=34508 RepID=A0A4U5PFM6_STECR|nr:hypothetical protein L596_009264 [Steinernema carpocapsae]
MAGGPKSECPQSSEDPYEDAKSPKRRATETAKTERKPVGAGIPNRKSCREMPKKSVTPKGGDLGTITYEEGTRRNKGSCEKTQEHEPTPSKPMFRFDGLRRKIEDLRKKNKRKSQSSNDLPPNMSRERFDFSREKPSNMNTMADRTVQEHEFTEAPAPAEQKSKEEKKHVCKEAAPNTEREKGDPYEDKASVRQGTNKRPYVKMNDMENKSLSRLEWYHGYMPREEIEELLKKDGEFCLRKTDVGNNERYAVSVFWGDHVRHILPRLNNENKWTIRDVAFEKVERLLIFYITSKAELQPCGTKLLKPFHRPDWYILHEHVTLKKKLGSGNFGDVFLAELCDTKSGKIPVAVKTLRGKLKKNERAQFVKEASMMRRFNHENIVRILGVAPQQEPIMILLELASGGCLKSHCRDKAELTVSQLSNYCLDAAKGMEYLSSQLVIHRDIAARNCLLGRLWPLSGQPQRSQGIRPEECSRQVAGARNPHERCLHHEERRVVVRRHDVGGVLALQEGSLPRNDQQGHQSHGSHRWQNGATSRDDEGKRRYYEELLEEEPRRTSRLARNRPPPERRVRSEAADLQPRSCEGWAGPSERRGAILRPSFRETRILLKTELPMVRVSDVQNVHLPVLHEAKLDYFFFIDLREHIFVKFREFS